MNKLIEEILNLHNECFLDKKTYENIQNIFNNSRYMIEYEYIGETLASYMIIHDSVDIYELIEIAVNSKFRRQNLAKTLLEKLPKDKEIHLEVSNLNEAAIKLYLSCGFNKIFFRKNYYLDNSDAYIMKK